MYVQNHGGDCCGIRHIIGFPGSVSAGYIASLDTAIKGVPANRLMEVTLIDGQLKAWWPELRKRGFRQVTRFRNSNSGNYVTVLHFVRKPAPLKEVEAATFPTFQPVRDASGRFARKDAAGAAPVTPGVRVEVTAR